MISTLLKGLRNWLTGDPVEAAISLIKLTRHDPRLTRLLLVEGTEKNTSALSKYLNKNYSDTLRAHVAPNVLAEYGDQP